MTQIIGEEAMGKLEGKIALVTGGSSGIGLATARQFVNEGAYVFITGRHQPELDAAVKDIGKNITAVSSDVSNLGDLDHLFAQIKSTKGRLDVLFCECWNREVREIRRDNRRTVRFHLRYQCKGRS